MLEAAETEVSRSFLCLWFVVSQSVMPVGLFVYLAEQNALLCGEDVWLCMCACVRVGLDSKIICPCCSPFVVMNKTNSHRWRIVFGGLPALRMAQGPQRRSLAVSGARLCGWLVCDGFQTLLVSMILSAGQ